VCLLLVLLSVVVVGVGVGVVLSYAKREERLGGCDGVVFEASGEGGGRVAVEFG